MFSSTTTILISLLASTALANGVQGTFTSGTIPVTAGPTPTFCSFPGMPRIDKPADCPRNVSEDNIKCCCSRFRGSDLNECLTNKLVDGSPLVTVTSSTPAAATPTQCTVPGLHPIAMPVDCPHTLTKDQLLCCCSPFRGSDLAKCLGPDAISASGSAAAATGTSAASQSGNGTAGGASGSSGSGSSDASGSNAGAGTNGSNGGSNGASGSSGSSSSVGSGSGSSATNHTGAAVAVLPNTVAAWAAGIAGVAGVAVLL